jgi:hypothetical protein
LRNGAGHAAAVLHVVVADDVQGVGFYGVGHCFTRMRVRGTEEDPHQY